MARRVPPRFAARLPLLPASSLLAAFLVLVGGMGANASPAAAREAPPAAGAATNGSHAPAYLGLLLGGPVSPGQAFDLGLSTVEFGCVVTSVDPGSPADRANLRLGDLVLEADGHAIRSPHDLDAVVGRHAPGTPITVLVRRGQETREIAIDGAELPRGDLRFGVGRIFDRDPTCAQLPPGVPVTDSLATVNWVAAGFGPLIHLQVGDLVTSVNGRPIRSAREFGEIESRLRVGEDLCVRYYSRGRTRQVSYLAQAVAVPWQRLGLEEITPTLMESESLSLATGEAPGLFVRRIEPGSAGARAGLRPGDRILALAAEPPTAGIDSAEVRRRLAQADSSGMQTLTSATQFDSLYASAAWPFVCRLRVARGDSVLGPIRLERDWRSTFRSRPSVRSGGNWDLEWSPLPQRPDVFGATVYNGSPVSTWFIVRKKAIPFPMPALWTKVTGPCFGGLTGVRWDASRHSGRSVIHPGAETLDPATLSLEWRWNYGFGDKRWHHRVDFTGRETWIPDVTYSDQVQPFYHEEISNRATATISSMFVGQDKLRYTLARGWSLRWSVPLPGLPGHKVELSAERIRETPVANVPTASLFGTSRFDPNPILGVAGGLRNSASLRYSYSSLRQRAWTQTLVEGEARAAGGVLGGDFDFVRWEANATRSFRLTRRLYLDSRLKAGLATGRLPLQEEFSCGGLGTLPGYEDFRFVGDRTLLGRTRVSLVPFGLPEQDVQFRVFAGLSAGNAWRAVRISGVPRLRSDLALGAGVYFATGGALLYPSGVSVAWARPLDEGIGRWRVQIDFSSGAIR